MPARLQKTKKSFAFSAGFNTEGSKLVSVNGAVIDGKNMQLLRDGTLIRRKGLELLTDFGELYPGLGGTPVLEAYFQAHVHGIFPSNFKGKPVKYYLWRSAAGPGNDFLVVFDGDIHLNFYELNRNPTDLASCFVFQINIPATTTARLSDISFDASSNQLIVAANYMLPLLVTYNMETSSLIYRQINLRIRDITGAPGANNLSRPTFLTADHQYNLQNQGWGTNPRTLVSATPDGNNIHYGTPIPWYFRYKGVYPGNGDIYHLAKLENAKEVLGIGAFDPFRFDQLPDPTRHAPRGHFIMDVRTNNRQSTPLPGFSGGTKITPGASTIYGPACAAFFAGRIAYAGIIPSSESGSVDTWSGKIYISQLLEDNLENIGHCYSKNDPTDPDINGPQATDGVELLIKGAGQIQRLIPFAQSLLAVTSRGIWALGGQDPQAGFSATSFGINKLIETTRLYPESMIVIDNVLYYWADDGIYRLTYDFAGGAQAENLTASTIQTYFNTLDDHARRTAFPVYITTQRRVEWMFQKGNTFGTTSSAARLRNAGLAYDLVLQAWSPPATYDSLFTTQYYPPGGPWTPGTTQWTPIVIGAIERRTTLNTISESNVVTTNNDPILAVGGDNVVVSVEERTVQDPQVTYIVGSPCLRFGNIIDPADDYAGAELVYVPMYARATNPTARDWESRGLRFLSFANTRGLFDGGTGYARCQTYETYCDVGAIDIVSLGDDIGDYSRIKGAPDIWTYVERTETDVVPQVQYLPQPGGLFVLGDDAPGPYVYNTVTNEYRLSPRSGAYAQYRWDWAEYDSGTDWSPRTSVYKLPRHIIADPSVELFEPSKVIVTRERIKGRGRHLTIRFSADTDKAFHLLGFELAITVKPKRK